MKKKYKTILLDQDSCLASFTQAVVTQLNTFTGQNVTMDRVVRECNWDLEKLWGMTQKEWWEAIDENPNFWLEIPMFEWSDHLYNELQKHADEVVIMTAPAQNPMCIAHKLIWLKDYMNIMPSHVITGKKKYLLARSDALLVDDAPHNIDSFVANGGNGALVPSDWNTTDLDFSMVWDAIEKKL